ncbi:MAG: aminotransferase class IV [Candidatus Omnitrophota bacterium]|nr:aminotransferase class IV [Candidatus Omnitrophota bacterium]
MRYAVYQKGRKIQDKVSSDVFTNTEIGIFETLQAYEGEVFRLPQHLDRLLESAKTVGYPGRLDPVILEREVRQAVAAYRKEFRKDSNLTVRLTLHQNRSVVFVGERAGQTALYHKGVALKTSPVRKSHWNAAAPEAKSASYQNAIMAMLQPNPVSAYEDVFLDAGGYVTEARVGNLFVVSEAETWLETPPAAGILNGITRRFVIECARSAGIKIRETPLTRHHVYNAREAFLTNTTWEILPVSELDGRKIGGRIPGLITAKLHQIYKKRVTRECRRKSNTVR